MIASHDRSGWIGASDAYRVMQPWNTEAFARWWAVKLGLRGGGGYASTEMLTGTAYEHRILDAIGVRERDRQIRIEELRLQVNLDGEDETTVYEVKTHHAEKPFRMTSAYVWQCQVERFASGKNVVIVSYGLQRRDYDDWANEIDLRRIARHPIPYNRAWIMGMYLPRLVTLRDALIEGSTPSERDVGIPRDYAQYMDATALLREGTMK